MLSTLTHTTKRIKRERVKRETRINSIDILRGAVMVIMALDHVRHIFHQPAMIDEPTNLATTTPILFFTRWITHFCAPVFLFLSGVSASISGQKKTKNELSFFLIKRGVWLLVVELVIITFGLSFDPAYNLFLLQVIWAIGWSMIILGLLVRTSLAVIISVGAIIFFGHNVLDYIDLPNSGVVSVLWDVFFTSSGKAYPIGGGRAVLVMYAVLPWTAIMIGGFVAGRLYAPGYDRNKRKDILLLGGIILSALFIILRMTKGYGDPAPWSDQKNAVYSFLSLLNVTKYPVSLQYACMTLGPALVILAVVERVKGRFVDVVSVFGRVPFFYYVLHFYLLHLLCVGLFFASGYGFNEILSKGSFIFFRPLDFGFSLFIVYIIWFVVVALLYWPCKWFSRYKKTHKQWWLSYV